MPKKRQCTYGGCKTTVFYDGSDDSPRCDRHKNLSFTPKKVYHDHQYHRAKYFYGTNEWKKLSIEYRRHQPLCEHCLKRDVITEADCVDHIVEIEDGGDKLEWDNLQSLCNACHNIKTGQEKRKRERRKKNNGFGNISDY